MGSEEKAMVKWSANLRVDTMNGKLVKDGCFREVLNEFGRKVLAREIGKGSNGNNRRYLNIMKLA